MNHIAMGESNESVCILHFRKRYTVLNVQLSLFRSFVWTICNHMHKFCKTICVAICVCATHWSGGHRTHNDFPVDFTDAKMKNLQKRISDNNKLNLRNLDFKKNVHTRSKWSLPWSTREFSFFFDYIGIHKNKLHMSIA